MKRDTNEGVTLQQSANGLTLVGGGMEVRADFARMLPRIAPGKLNRELLVKAAKVKGAGAPDGADTGAGRAPRAVDATAGLGEDALLLAAAGFEVRLFERNATIAALLQDALDRAAGEPKLAPVVARMHLTCQDSIAGLAELHGWPDVVLLDPMFPGRHKSAAVKKKLQLLQQLEEPCADEAALLDAALEAGPRKVVVKRPAKGPNLAGRAPSYSLEGKAIRFDVYALP